MGRKFGIAASAEEMAKRFDVCQRCAGHCKKGKEFCCYCQPPITTINAQRASYKKYIYRVTLERKKEREIATTN